MLLHVAATPVSTNTLYASHRSKLAHLPQVLKLCPLNSRYKALSESRAPETALNYTLLVCMTLELLGSYL